MVDVISIAKAPTTRREFPIDHKHKFTQHGEKSTSTI